VPKSDEIDELLSKIRQGDFVLEPQWDFYIIDNTCSAQDTSVESSPRSPDQRRWKLQVSGDVRGVVILTQTCDIVRSACHRPYLELSPLVKVSEKEMPLIAKGSSPRYAFIPALKANHLVVDLDRCMSITKRAFIMARPDVKNGLRDDAEIRAFATALRRKRGRHAFPKKLSEALAPFIDHVRRKHNRESELGQFLAECREIRVGVKPSLHSDCPEVSVYFLFEHIVDEVQLDRFRELAERLILERIKLPDGWAEFEPVVQDMDGISARIYLSLYQLDFENLSSG
jgi:hypothetical protein